MDSTSVMPRLMMSMILWRTKPSSSRFFLYCPAKTFMKNIDDPFYPSLWCKTLKFDIQNQPSFSHFTIVRVYQCLVKQTMLKKKIKHKLFSYLPFSTFVNQHFTHLICANINRQFCILRIYMMIISIF